ncbi:MAG: T9SS type A sorting domain-containing protein [Crocinitomicaceae bacterium]|nr:T9SS type A sorting domain-containing protein [Crocinitomicaceae bacterium]
MNTLEITNSIGEVVYKKDDCYGQATVKIDFSSFASGVYLVKNSNAETSEVYRLILK